MVLSKGSSGTISTGDMRSSVIFQKSIPTSDGAGGQVDNYTTFYTCRGRLRQSSGRRSDEQMELVRNKTMELIVRYTTTIADNLDETTRIIINGDTYMVQNFELVDEIPHWYKFTIAKNV